MKIFVTGGAGYIGSHVVSLLGQDGHEVVVYDNLSSGHQWSVLYGKLVKGDLADQQLLSRTISDFSPAAVMHFAASIQVEESIRCPLLYYQNNVANTLNLLKVTVENNVPYFIYSSSAAVYGIPETVPVDESASLCPINPYGTSKVMVENILQDLANASGLKYIALRYFNAAGADPDGRLGQSYKKSTHLITRALKAAKGELDRLIIYGTDYDTPDGTCIRDYIHVMDIAGAHSSALHYLIAIGNGEIGSGNALNCGYGHGFSVREVVDMVKKVTGIDFKVEEADRRPGDAPLIIASAENLKKYTGWKPQYDDLEYIIKTAWMWEKKSHC
jgi:UDP-glucose 4-epimerase